MRFILFLASLCISSLIYAQPACSPIGVLTGGDEPPGCKICENMFRGTNSNATPDSIEHFSCFEVENSVWATIPINDYGRLEFEFIVMNCENGDGLEFNI